ncbi:hypothetical protein NDU88_005267 [Pleurodeles waltl]|uniref:Uncharacterized protein n=1 Tax=Pleurodeles waltl TaxID=8319 RepID=A0AAV7TU96_PLEWA|nr:hypothetical protein NDU88_005267 [Pleurodeles waltl]
MRNSEEGYGPGGLCVAWPADVDSRGEEETVVCQAHLLSFLSKLRVIANDSSYFFMEPADAWDCLNQHKYELSELGTPKAHKKRLTRCRKRHHLRGSGGTVMTGAPTLAQAHAEHMRAVLVATTMWVGWAYHLTDDTDGAPLEAGSTVLDHNTTSAGLPIVTPQMADDIV